jgi:hypothetical protein
MAAQPAVTNNTQTSFEETILANQECIDVINAWCDAGKELSRLAKMRQTIRELKKQKRDANGKIKGRVFTIRFPTNTCYRCGITRAYHKKTRAGCSVWGTHYRTHLWTIRRKKEAEG